MHDLTLVLNPKARRPRLTSTKTEALQDMAGRSTRVCVTQNLTELDSFVATDLLAQPVSPESNSTLCFYGGDGSIGRGLTSLFRELERRGEPLTAPPVLPVKAGTFNMLCMNLGFKESAEKTLRRWKAEKITQQMPVPCLRVDIEGEAPIFGFVFAWGVGFRVLKAYYAQSSDPGIWDGAVVAAKSLLGGLAGGSDLLPLYKSERLNLKWNANGAAGSRDSIKLRSIAAGTISRFSLGMRPLPRPLDGGNIIAPGTFHFSANGMLLPRIVWHSPTLLFGLFDQTKLDLEHLLISHRGVASLEVDLSEGITLDGEVYEWSGSRKVRISAGPVISMWLR